jgi:hypothetical protein
VAAGRLGALGVRVARSAGNHGGADAHAGEVEAAHWDLSGLGTVAAAAGHQQDPRR